jgi:ankyrin repeat protein
MNSPLHTAAENGSQHTVELLISSAANINIINSKGDTPLHSATWNGQTDCVSHLLKAGADIDIRNKEGKNALFIAIEERFPDCVETLIRHGSDESCIDINGTSIPQIIQECRNSDSNDELEFVLAYEKVRIALCLNEIFNFLFV